MGSRDNCPAVETALTALVPLREEQKVNKQTDKSISGIVEGLTTSERRANASNLLQFNIMKFKSCAATLQKERTLFLINKALV
jgi:hypothetical protein